MPVPNLVPPAHASSQSSNTTEIAKHHSMPDHWRNDFPTVHPRFQPFTRFAFRMLCLIALGRTDLEHKWKALTIEDEKEYKDGVTRVLNMVNAVIVIVSSLISRTLCWRAEG